MGLRKLFTLSYWEEDGTLQMYDTHLKRTFLKRTVPPERPKLGDFYIGALTVVCARPLRVLDYGDDLTRRRYASVRGTACMLVKPDAYHAAGKIITMIYDANLHIGRLRMLRLSESEAADFLSLTPASAAAGRGSGGGVAPADSAIAHLGCDVVLALEITGDDVMARLHELAGPADPLEAKELAPVSIRCVNVSPPENHGLAVTLAPSRCGHCVTLAIRHQLARACATSPLQGRFWQGPHEECRSCVS
jgi:nucleoside-diphosphate kinase